MNTIEKKQLEDIVNKNDYENNTDKLRELKQSANIKKDIVTMQKLKLTHSKMREIEPDKFSQLCSSQCYYLFNHYNFIYKKLFNDEISPELLNQIVGTLEQIEFGNIDQHEGSVIVGKLLKKIYIDTKVKDEPTNPSEENLVQPLKVSWKDYKSNRQ
jgi:hypothetical protein